jgi:heat shock protein HslJ
MRGLRPAVIGLVAAASAAAVVAALGAIVGWWTPPALAELDLGASGAEQADGLWRVEELAPGGTAVPLVPGTTVVLALDTTTATLRGDAGCNALLGSFTLSPHGAASVTVPSTQRRDCGDALREQERAVRAVLAGATSWQVEDGRLELTGLGGHLVLVPS